MRQIPKKSFETALAKYTYVLVCIFLLTVSCNKNNPPNPEIEEALGEQIFNKLISVRNFGEPIPEGSPATTNLSPLYYSLENNAPVDATQVQSTRWDISFSQILRSFINANNHLAGLGQGGPGKGGTLLVQQKFEDVIDIPADALFHRGDHPYGTDQSGAFAEGLGWYVYDFSGTIRGNGQAHKAHVAYPIQEHTLIVRTAIGNYAKIKMQSIYKDLLNPIDWYTDSPAPYFSFQYVLVEAGSRTFSIN